MHIIGISGKKQSGKDALTTALRLNFNGESRRIALADPLKEEVARACGVSTQFIDNHKPDFRKMLQWWGTDFRRKFKHDNYWIEQLFRNILAQPPEVGLVVVPDVRFLNEATYIKEAGGLLIRVTRPLPNDDKHISETDLDDYKFSDILLNTGTLDDIDKFSIDFLNKHNIPCKH